MITMGSLLHPVQLDPWQTIVAVGWSPGGLVVIEATGVPGIMRIETYDPEVAPVDLTPVAGQTIDSTYYNSKYIIHPGSIAVDAGQWQAENPFDVIFVDYFANDPTADVDEVRSSHDSGVAATGREPDIVFVNNMIHFVKDTVTQPNGHSVTFYGHHEFKNPWYAITDGYGEPAADPDPLITYSGNTGQWWTHAKTIPPVDYEQYKQVWIMNFKTVGAAPEDLIKTGIIVTGGPYTPCTFRMRGFPQGVKFTFNADATVTVTNANGTPATPKWTGTGSQADGPFRYFNSGGLIPLS